MLLAFFSIWGMYNDTVAFFLNVSAIFCAAHLLLWTTLFSYYNLLLWGQTVQITTSISFVMVNDEITSCFPALKSFFWTSQFIFFSGFVFVFVFFIPTLTTRMRQSTSASPTIMGALLWHCFLPLGLLKPPLNIFQCVYRLLFNGDNLCCELAVSFW